MKTIAMVMLVVCASCAASAPKVDCATEYPRCDSPRFDSWADIERLCADGVDVWLPECTEDGVLSCRDGVTCSSGEPVCTNACERL